jgi:hypothetical protein
VPDSTADQTTAWIALNPESFATTQVVAHEFMHVLQQSLYAHQALWIDESSAQWAAARVPGAVAAGTLLPLVYPAAPHVPLDSSATTYQQWPFFEAVAERLGDDWVRKLYERSAVLGAADHGLAAMDDVAAATGSSLAAEFDAYARRNLTGAYSFAPLAGIAAEPAFTVQTASSSAAEGDRPLDGVSTALDHLSALYVRYAGGDPCRGGETLHLSTTLPAGVPGTPAFQDRTATAAAVAPFTISGSSAAFEAPWDPCSHEGTLMLDNASTALDGQSYAVPARITYAPPDSPPGTTQRHPRLVPHFPKRFVVSRRRRVLVLKLSLDRGPAQLTLKLAPKVTKTVELRPGDHTVRLKLPRAFRAGIHRLTLVTRAPHSVPGAPRWQTVVWAVRIGFRR